MHIMLPAQQPSSCMRCDCSHISVSKLGAELVPVLGGCPARFSWALEHDECLRAKTATHGACCTPWPIGASCALAHASRALRRTRPVVLGMRTSPFGRPSGWRVRNTLSPVSVKSCRNSRMSWGCAQAEGASEPALSTDCMRQAGRSLQCRAACRRCARWLTSTVALKGRPLSFTVLPSWGSDVAIPQQPPAAGLVSANRQARWLRGATRGASRTGGEGELPG